MPPSLGAESLHLRINLFHGHRLDAGRSDTIGDAEKPGSGLLPSDRVREQTAERFRREQPGGARGLRRIVG